MRSPIISRVISRILVLSLLILLASLGYLAHTAVSQKKSKASSGLPWLENYLDHDLGFAYFPVKGSVFLEGKRGSKELLFEGAGTLELFERWRTANPNKVIVTAFGDGLGDKGTNKGYFIIYSLQH